MAIKKYAEIKNGKVKNISIWETGTQPSGFKSVDAIPDCQMGATFNGGSSYTRKLPPKIGKVVISPSEINLGESATVTVTAYTNKYDNIVNTAFTGKSRNISVTTPEGVLIRLKFTFTDGVATKSVTPQQVGVYTVQPLPNEKEVQLIGDMTLDVLTV